MQFRFWRYSLRTFFVIVTILCLVCGIGGWLAYHRSLTNRESDFVVAVQSTQIADTFGRPTGYFKFDYEYSWYGEKLHTNDWGRGNYDSQWEVHGDYASVPQFRATPVPLWIEAIPIWRKRPGWTSGCDKVNPFARVVYARLSREMIEEFGDGIAKLSAMRGLDLLCDELSGLDRSLFASMSQLIYVEAEFTHLPPGSLTFLADETLNLIGCTGTNESLGVLKQCDRLARLRLGSADVDQKALEALAEVSNLHHLELVNCDSIDDESIPYLARFDFLDTLDISLTNLTEPGVERLRASLPNTRVIFDEDLDLGDYFGMYD